MDLCPHCNLPIHPKFACGEAVFMYYARHLDEIVVSGPKERKVAHKGRI